MEERIICDRVASLRTEYSITCDTIAKKLNLKVSTYCRYEESGGFTYSELSKIADFFNVSLNFLLNGDETEPVFGSEVSVNENIFENKTVLKEPDITVFDPSYTEHFPDDDILFFKK